MFSCSHTLVTLIVTGTEFLPPMTERYGKLKKLQEQQLIPATLAFSSRHEKETITYSFRDQFPIIEISHIPKYSHAID